MATACKATLCLHGHDLYTEIWNDQAPLHTFLISQVLKDFSPSILGPRLVTVAFSLLLLVSFYTLVNRISGVIIAALATALLIASPGFEGLMHVGDSVREKGQALTRAAYYETFA